MGRIPRPTPPVAGGRPVLAGQPPPPGGRPRTPTPPARPRWTFAFRFFRQVRFFALEGTRPTYLAAVLERLAALSDLFVDEATSGAMAEGLRCHEVHWGNASHFTRPYFDWVPPEYLEHEEDYPFMQFSISTSLGRVVGFFDERQVFQIIALDPKHNIQISRGHESRVDCDPVHSDFHAMQAQIDRALRHLDDTPKGQEKCRERLARVLMNEDVARDGYRVIVELEKSDADELHRHLSQPGRTVRDVVERGLQSYLLEADAILAATTEDVHTAAPTDPIPELDETEPS